MFKDHKIPISHKCYSVMIRGIQYFQYEYETELGWTKSKPMNLFAAELCRKQTAKELIKKIRGH
jgi:hypothetical protein